MEDFRTVSGFFSTVWDPKGEFLELPDEAAGHKISTPLVFYVRSSAFFFQKTFPAPTLTRHPFSIIPRDYPEGEVILGMELRMHSLKAAPVDTANAEFQRPGVTTALEDVTEESVRLAVAKVLKHFNWKGPVGVSVTRAIMRALGNEATAKNLNSMMPKSKGKVAVMIHTEAAAYTELMFGPGRETNGVVVVVTIGKGFGTVTYNKGQKVRNSDLKHLTWTYERELGKLQEKFDWMGVAPRLDEGTAEEVVELITHSPPSKALFSSGRGGANPFYECELRKMQGLESILAWATLIDKYIQKIAASVKPEQIILLTTGAASDLPEELLLPLLKPGVAAAGLDPSVMVIGDFPDRALVKGAAVGAHIELGRRQAAEILRAAVTETVTGRPEPREIFEQDLLWAFKRMDRDGNGLLSHEDLVGGVKLMGTSFSDTEITGILRDFTGGLQDEATPAHFTAWFNRMVDLASSKVHVVHSEDEFLQNMEAARERPSMVTGQVADDGSLVVLECGYTHCRPCMMFEKQYEGLASKYLDTVFLKVMGDECPGSAHLCRDVLEVSGTPEFRFYRGGSLIHVMNGADKAKLEANVQRFLQAGEFGARSHIKPAEGAPLLPKKERLGNSVPKAR
tara:strand:- start:16649 stop:18517 length:1869 start_codon:yes stop_codon:yes gene_type:complete